MSQPAHANAVLDGIPPPDVIRRLIQQSIRDTAMLRKLLKVSERRRQYEERDRDLAGARERETARA